MKMNKHNSTLQQTMQITNAQTSKLFEISMTLMLYILFVVEQFNLST